MRKLFTNIKLKKAKSLFTIGIILTLVVTASLIYISSQDSRPVLEQKQISAQEVSEMIGEEVVLSPGGNYNLTTEQFETFVAKVTTAKPIDGPASETSEANGVGDTFAQVIAYPGSSSSLNATGVEVNLPKGLSSEELLITYREMPNLFETSVDEAKFFELTAENTELEDVAHFDKELAVTVELEQAADNFRSMYFDEGLNEWVRIPSSFNDNKLTFKTDHFTTFVVINENTIKSILLKRPIFVELGSCEVVVDDSDVPCSDQRGEWTEAAQGYKSGSMYTNEIDPAVWFWHTDAAKLLDENGNPQPLEVFASLPEVDLPGGGTVTPNAYYYVLDETGITRLVVNQRDFVGTLANLGTFSFNDKAGVAVTNQCALGACDNTESQYIVADAISFGVEAGGTGGGGGIFDFIPPLIEDVLVNMDSGFFYVQAKVTDQMSGVARVYLYMNGVPVELNADGDIYSGRLAIEPGDSLDYYIMAYDGAGNVTIWNPTSGFISRGMAEGLGLPLLYKPKEMIGNAVAAMSPGPDLCVVGCSGDPINNANGNFFDQVELVNIPGRPAIDLTITHNSQGGLASIFGENWTHSFGYKLSEMNNQYFTGVFVYYPDGQVAKFEGADLTPERGSFDRLQRSGDGFVLKRKDNNSYVFNSAGNLVRVEDPDGNGLSLSYVDANQDGFAPKLSKVSADGGREITFKYSAKGVSRIGLPEGLMIKLKYDSNGDLVEITDENSGQTRFEYQSHAMTKKFSPEGHTYFANTYDAKSRVKKQVVGEAFVLNYRYGSGKTTVTDKNGNAAVYHYDARGNITELVDSEGHSKKYEYNNADLVRAEITGEGHRFQYKYDQAGNQTVVIDPLAQRTTREFNQWHKPVREVLEDPNQTYTYEYNNRGNLTKVVDPFGNYRSLNYNFQGRLTSESDFRGNLASYSYSNSGDLVRIQDAEGNVTHFEYDGLGRLVKETDARGHVFTYKYDGVGNLTKMTGPLGYSSSLVYDQNHRLVSQTDAMGNTTSFEYDNSQNLVAVIDAMGNKSEWEYGDMNELLSQIDPLTRVAKFSYDKNYSPESTINADGGVTSIELNSVRIPQVVTDANGNKSSYEYDELYRVSKLAEDIDGVHAISSFEYTFSGRVSKLIDAEGNETRYEYDLLDRIVSETDAKGAVTTYTYDNDGNLTELIDANGNKTWYEYDRLGQLFSIHDANGGVLWFSYDSVGNLVESKNQNGVVTEFEYDGLGRMIKQTEAGLITAYEYDLNGNLTMQTNPRGFTTSYAYDALNRLISQTDAKGNVTSLGYDAVGNLTQAVDRNGNSIGLVYDELNRITAEVNAKGHTARYRYDDVGNLLASVDQRGNETKYVYNGLNQNTRVIDALNGVTKYSYDGLGNVLKSSDANGNATAYIYDSVYNLRAVTNPEGDSWLYSYDLNGNLVRTNDSNRNITNYRYDSLNRLAAVIDAQNGETSYAYDAVGNLMSENDANGHVDAFQYDDLNRLAKYIDAAGNATNFEYDEQGNQTRMIDANGNATGFEFDQLDRLITRVNSAEERTAYEYDNERNIVAEIAPDGVRTAYGYDKVYQLNSVSLDAGTNGSGVTTKYAYDANGNLVKVIEPKGNKTTFKYDALNRQIEEVNALGSSWNYLYDSVGNRTAQIDANGHRTSYAYHPDNMLRKISYFDGSNIAYQYDANNNRVQMQDNLGTTVWSYDSLNRMLTETDSLGRNKHYAYDAVGNTTEVKYPDGRVVSYGYQQNDWLEEVITPGADSTRYERDSVGNVVRQTNPNNTVTTTAYDQVYRPIEIINEQMGGKVNSSFAYSYDSAGQRTQVVQQYAHGQLKSVTETYTYDALRRLTGSSASTGVTNTYNYDLNSNRVSWVSNDNSNTPKPFDRTDLSYEYDDINALIRVTESKDKASGGNGNVQGNSTQTKPAPSSPVNQSKTKKVTEQKPIPQVVSGFTKELNNFLKYLETQKDKQVGTAAYNDLFGQVTDFITTSKQGFLTQTQAQQKYNKLVSTIDKYVASKQINSGGVGNSLKVKLSDVEAVISTLPAQIQYQTITKVVPISGTNNIGQVAGVTAANNPKPVKVKEILFSYDPNGNRVQRLVKDPFTKTNELRTDYIYNPEDRLTGVTNYQRAKSTNEWIVRDVTGMEYDGMQRRLVKEYDPKLNVGGQGDSGLRRTDYVYDGLDVIAKYSVQNEHYQNLYRGGSNQIINSQVFTPDPDSDSSGYWYHYDALGSVVGVTKDSGQSHHNYRYEDFGEMSPDKVKFGDNSFTYTGQEYDEANNIYEFYSRAYDPEMGVWLQQDNYRGNTSDPMSLLRYKYVGNSPVNYKDAYGYFAVVVPVGYVVGGVVISGVGYLASQIDWDAIGNWTGDHVSTTVTGVGAGIHTIGTFADSCIDAGARLLVRGPETLSNYQKTRINLLRSTQDYLGDVTLHEANDWLKAEEITSKTQLNQHLQSQASVAGSIDPDDLDDKKFRAKEKDYELSDHARSQMDRRGLGLDDVVEAIEQGESISYQNANGPVTGYRSANGTYVAVGDNGNIITVINNTSERYLQNILNNPIYYKP